MVKAQTLEVSAINTKLEEAITSDGEIMGFEQLINQDGQDTDHVDEAKFAMCWSNVHETWVTVDMDTTPELTLN